MIFDDKQSAILVRLRIQGLELDLANPAWIINAFTGGLLNDLITVELTAAGLLTDRALSGQMPFLGWFLFEVRDVHRAGVIVREVLQRNSLDIWATVLRFDADELVWRSMYPRGSMMLTEEVTAETLACAAEASNVLALWRQLLKNSNPSESDANKQ